MDIGDFPSFVLTSTVLSQDEPSEVQLLYRRPAIATTDVISSVWTVSPAAGTVITDTIVLGSLDGGRYRSVVSSRGVCQSVLANFNCEFDKVAPGLPPVVISATVETARPGRVQEAIQVATFRDNFIFTATTNVLPSDIEPLELVLDVNPFSRRNRVNLQRPRLIFIVYSTPLLQVGEEIDRSTIRFGRTGLEDSVGFCFRFDIGRDGLRDLVCVANTEAAGFQPGDTEAVVTGKTFDGQEAVGTTFIQTFPPAPQVTGS